jgi:hypothetical protein
MIGPRVRIFFQTAPNSVMVTMVAYAENHSCRPKKRQVLAKVPAIAAECAASAPVGPNWDGE